jgi:hypothetical protein
MIEANKNESFPIAVTLINDETGELETGEQVFYDIRDMNDIPLNPAISGTLTESTVEYGVYKTEVSILDAGLYICYATCSGFLAGTEEIVIHEENIYDLAKSHRPYNVSVEDVIRTTDDIDRTPSQIARKVPLGKTDYIITKIKSDEDSNWENPISEGISYAHYVSEDQDLPYMMGGEF